MTAWDAEADRARVDVLRRDLGDRLATYRRAAGFTQCALAEAIGRSRTVVLRAEAGTRGMPAAQWAAADEVCGAEGALVAAYGVLAAAVRDQRARVESQRCAARLAAAQAEVDALPTSPAPRLGVIGHAEGPGLAGVGGELAEELMQVVERLVRKMGRRDAMRVAGLTLATVGLSGVDADECARVALALGSPQRVDAKVVGNLAGALAHCKRQEDALGPAAVLTTVVAQHGVVRSLLEGAPEELSRSLSALESDMASAIGGYLLDLGDLDGAVRHLRVARRAGHDARSPAFAAKAAVNMSLMAYRSGEAHTAMDAAAAARSLAARTDDPQLKALAEQRAADAYALDGQHVLCVAAHARARSSSWRATRCLLPRRPPTGYMRARSTAA